MEEEKKRKGKEREEKKRKEKKKKEKKKKEKRRCEKKRVEKRRKGNRREVSKLDGERDNITLSKKNMYVPVLFFRNFFCCSYCFSVYRFRRLPFLCRKRRIVEQNKI